MITEKGLLKLIIFIINLSIEKYRKINFKTMINLLNSNSINGIQVTGYNTVYAYYIYV